MSFGLFIKKFVSFFFEPIGIVITLFVIGLYYLYQKKHYKAEQFLLGSVLVLALFAYPPFSNFLVKKLENQYPKYDYSQNIKYIHVLGNGHTTDSTQPLSSQIASSGVKRILEGIIIHNKIPGSKIIFTGYAGNTDVANAVMNAKLSYALGTDQNSTIINPKPEDTREEAEFTKTIVGDEPFVLVTSASHMPRAMMLFQSYGMHPIAAPTAFYKDNNMSWLSAPNSGALFVSTLAMHEYIGMLYAKIRGVFS
ncbi:ElyC/SanA/YdcF family protein [Sulfurimonas sp. C5]|uniref:ElyC/SanA/YdcF family protein n=1 Tax=Sulfurimonas sp. C5 TaxID=3036947 RepID=UPI002454B652|nr:ElyC/SanA/YdcF family protein [Sulfurimonas sp. C5]MDH4943792.1 ElyC/SanA/YdcF family protein [Sulfurimonas sp. C5]